MDRVQCCSREHACVLIACVCMCVHVRARVFPCVHAHVLVCTCASSLTSVPADAVVSFRSETRTPCVPPQSLHEGSGHAYAQGPCAPVPRTSGVCMPLQCCEAHAPRPPARARVQSRGTSAARTHMPPLQAPCSTCAPYSTGTLQHRHRHRHRHPAARAHPAAQAQAQAQAQAPCSTCAAAASLTTPRKRER